MAKDTTIEVLILPYSSLQQTPKETEKRFRRINYTPGFCKAHTASN